MIGWNIVFVVVEASLICWAHFDAGVSWTAIGLGLGGVTVAGVGLFAYVALVATPRAIHRHHARFRAYAAASTTSTNSGREQLYEVVDPQPTPHPSAPFGMFKPPIQASRTR